MPNLDLKNVLDGYRCSERQGLFFVIPLLVALITFMMWMTCVPGLGEMETAKQLTIVAQAGGAAAAAFAGSSLIGMTCVNIRDRCTRSDWDASEDKKFAEIDNIDTRKTPIIISMVGLFFFLSVICIIFFALNGCGSTASNFAFGIGVGGCIVSFCFTVFVYGNSKAEQNFEAWQYAGTHRNKSNFTDYRNEKQRRSKNERKAKSTGTGTGTSTGTIPDPNEGKHIQEIDRRRLFTAESLDERCLREDSIPTSTILLLPLTFLFASVILFRSYRSGVKN